MELRNHVGEKLDYTLIERDNSPYIVIIGHGVTGNKDRPFLVALAESLNHAASPPSGFPSPVMAIRKASLPMLLSPKR